MISALGSRISIYNEKSLAVYLEKGGEVKVEKINVMYSLPTAGLTNKD
jgi:hypothetical protein